MEAAPARPVNELVNRFLNINFGVLYNEDDIFANCDAKTMSNYVRAFGNAFKNFRKEKLAAPRRSAVDADFPREKAIFDSISFRDDLGCLKRPFKDWEESDWVSTMNAIGNAVNRVNRVPKGNPQYRPNRKRTLRTIDKDDTGARGKKMKRVVIQEDEDSGEGKSEVEEAEEFVEPPDDLHRLSIVDYNRVQGENSILIEEHTQLLEKTSSLESQLKRNDNVVQRAIQERDEAKKQYEQLEERAQRLEEEVNRLKQENRSLRENINQLKDSEKRLKADLRTYREREKLEEPFVRSRNNKNK